jgi:MFS family permease
MMSTPESKPLPLRLRLVQLPRATWVICGGMFLNKLGNFLNVFLVLYLTHKGYSAFLAGTALGAIGLGSFFGNGVGGAVADRIGRRSTIVTSMFGTAAFTLLIPFCGNVYLIIGLAVVIGFFSQLYRPAGGAILVDTVEPEQRVTAFGLLRLAINLGMSIGAVIGGVLSGLDYNYLFIGNAVALALFGILAMALLPETKPVVEPAPPGTEPAPALKYRQVFADRSLQLYLLAILAATYVYTQTTATLPLRVHDLHLSNSFYGVLLSINAVMCVLIELPLIKFTGHRNPGRVLAVGMVLLAAGVGLTGLASNQVALVLTVVVWTFAEMIYTPVATTYPGLLAPEHLRGRYQGAEGIAITLAQTIGPSLGGLLYSVSQSAHWISCGVVALVGAAVILFAEDPRKRAAAADGVADGAAVGGQGGQSGDEPQWAAAEEAWLEVEGKP